MSCVVVARLPERLPHSPLPWTHMKRGPRTPQLPRRRHGAGTSGAKDLAEETRGVPLRLSRPFVDFRNRETGVFPGAVNKPWSDPVPLHSC